jgi:hypothetical protein
MYKFTSFTKSVAEASLIPSSLQVLGDYSYFMTLLHTIANLLLYTGFPGPISLGNEM